MDTISNNYSKVRSTCYDVEQLNKIGNNDKQFLLEMLQSFIELANECSESLLSATQKEDWQNVKTIAHKNIPSYSILGLNDLVEILKGIERDIDKNDVRKNAKKLVELFNQENKKVIKAIQEDIE